MGSSGENRPAAGLSADDRKILLGLARQAIHCEVRGRGEMLDPPNADEGSLNQIASCFVTLKHRGRLRGCIGHLEAQIPLWQAVCENARSAAVRDPRFDPVRVDELAELEIEISVLSEPSSVEIESPADLLAILRPGIDGVILEAEGRRATFLPQVWEKVASSIEFLEHLALKACNNPDAWKHPDTRVWIYNAESFGEHDQGRAS